MALEIERKFLLANEDWRADVERSVRMKQGYLGGDGVSVRIRIGGDNALINIKQNRLGKQREEFEYPVPMQDGLSLMNLSNGGKIEKTRHYLHHGGMLWEIDEFEGENLGLIVAEIELVAVGQAFLIPYWTGREVTDEERYYNVTLARHPYCHWKTT